VKNKPLAYF